MAKYNPKSAYHKIIIDNAIRKYGKADGIEHAMKEIANIGNPYMLFSKKSTKIEKPYPWLDTTTNNYEGKILNYGEEDSEKNSEKNSKKDSKKESQKNNTDIESTR
jgi:hypothetical protein